MTKHKEASTKQIKKRITGANKKTGKKIKESPPSSTIEKAKPELIIKPENNSAKRLMWLSVGLFTAVILILWGWAMKINLSNLNFRKSAEGQLLQRSQAEWDRLFNDTMTEQEQVKKTKQIKDNLKQIITAIIAASSTSAIGVTTSTALITTTNMATNTTSR